MDNDSFRLADRRLRYPGSEQIGFVGRSNLAGKALKRPCTAIGSNQPAGSADGANPMAFFYNYFTGSSRPHEHNLEEARKGALRR